MQRADSGRATAKTFFTTAFLAALLFFTIKTLPVYVHAYELHDHLRVLVIQAMAGQHPSVEKLRDNILAKAADLDLTVKSDDIKIEYTLGKIVIKLDYRVPVDLTVYVLNLHFTASADNRSLT
jgi:hypothetical protein